MRTSILLIVSLIMSGCCAKSPAPVTTLHSSLSPLAFLAGTWSEVKGDTITSEHWIAPGGKVLLGLGTTVEDGRTEMFEYLRIVSRKEGIFYIAQPRGDPPVEFKMVESSDQQFVFENPANEFPARIIYRKLDDETLGARIDGELHGEHRTHEWLYKKVK